MAYDAFISYSHEADEPLASALERGLQRLARPWHQRRGMSIFRDAGNLNLSAHLWGSIQQALDDSRFLIFVASPGSARSPWVTKEIEYRRTHRDVAQLIVVLSDGSLTWDFERGDFDGPQSTAIPASLHGAFQGEPFYLDMRWVRTDPRVSLENDRFKQQVVQIAAALKGVAVEDVIGEEVEQHRRMIRIRNAAIACLGVLSIAAAAFGVFAWIQRGVAIRSEQSAQRSADEARASASEAARQRNEAQRAQKEADASAVVATDKAAEADRERVRAEAEAHSARVALAQASTREAVRLIAENRPFHALAHLARALRASPDDLAARSWVSGLAHEGRSWMSLPHKAAVTSASFSSDGRRVLTRTADATMSVWDADAGRLLTGAPPKEARATWPMNVSRDGRRLVSVSWDRGAPNSDGKVTLSGGFVAQVWDPIAGKPIGTALRHQDEIRSVAFSPDGGLVVTSSKDKTVRLWNAVTGDLVGRPFVHPSAVKRAEFTADARRIVTGSDDGSVRVWDALGGELIVGPFQDGQRLDLMRLSEDGRRIFTVAYNNGVVWDALSGKALVPITHEREPITYAAFSRDGKFLAVGSSWERSARIWDVEAGKPVGPLLMHNDGLRSVEFSPDGRWLLTASDDKTARLWEVATGRQLGPPFRHDDKVATATFSPDGRRILTASDDKTARVWDVSSSQMLAMTLSDSQPVRWATFSPDGRRIVTACSDTQSRVRNVVDASEELALRHPGFVWTAIFSPDGRRRIVTASRDGTACIWVAHSGQRVGVPLQHSGRVFGAMFSPDGRRILTVSDEKTARLWDATTGRVLVTLGPHDGQITGMDFSEDGRRIAIASEIPAAHVWEEATTVRVWDAATGRPIGPPVRHLKKINFAELSPDGRRLLTASDDHSARLWDATTGRALLTLQHTDTVFRASFSPDGRSIVTASADGTARLWDARTGQPIGVPMSHLYWVRDAEFSADGRRVVTASMDKTARTWDAATGLPVGPPMTHSGQLVKATFSPDGRQVATITLDIRDNSVSVWNVLLGGSSPDEGLRLADLAEVVGGYRLTELGSHAPLTESERRVRVRRLVGSDGDKFLTLEQLLRPFLPGSR